MKELTLEQYQAYFDAAFAVPDPVPDIPAQRVVSFHEHHSAKLERERKHRRMLRKFYGIKPKNDSELPESFFDPPEG